LFANFDIIVYEQSIIIKIESLASKIAVSMSTRLQAKITILNHNLKIVHTSNKIWHFLTGGKS